MANDRDKEALHLLKQTLIDPDLARARPWIATHGVGDEGYSKALAKREKGRGEYLDLYLSHEPDPDRPIVVFHHIQKTAGTSLRHILFANYSVSAELQILLTPPDDLAAWHRTEYKSLGGSGRARLCCVAGHFANYFLPFLKRPAAPFTIIREPVDRALSRYHFYKKEKEWTVDDLYLDAERWGPSKAQFFNGQARSLLEPYHDVSQLPLTADGPDADLWRERLFGEALAGFRLGVQDRFDESVGVLARAYGWERTFEARARVNVTRPLVESLAPATLAAAQRSNWLDLELYAAAVAELDREVGAAGTRYDPPATTGEGSVT